VRDNIMLVTQTVRLKPVVQDVRTEDDGFAHLYLSHEDKEVRFNAVRQLRFVKPPLSIDEIKNHDGGNTLKQLQILQIRTDEADRHPMGTVGRTRKMSLDLVENVLASDLKPSAGEGYKKNNAAVLRGPGGTLRKDASEASERIQHESTGGDPIADFTRREAAIAQAASRQSEREKRNVYMKVGATRGQTLTGHSYGTCSVCRVVVHMNDDCTTRKHAAGKASIGMDDLPCEGSNALVCKLVENDKTDELCEKRAKAKAKAKARARVEGEVEVDESTGAKAKADAKAAAKAEAKAKAAAKATTKAANATKENLGQVLKYCQICQMSEEQLSQVRTAFANGLPMEQQLEYLGKLRTAAEARTQSRTQQSRMQQSRMQQSQQEQSCTQAELAFERELAIKAVKLLRCHREGIPSLLGLCVTHTSLSPTLDFSNQYQIPKGLQVYIDRLRRWAETKRQAQQARTQQSRTQQSRTQESRTQQPRTQQSCKQQSSRGAATAAEPIEAEEDDEVEVVGETSWEERDKDLRKHAIEVDLSAGADDVIDLSDE